MALDVIFLVDGSERSLNNFKKHKERFPYAKKFVTSETGTKAYKAASKTSNTSNFYLVDHDYAVDDKFDFSFMPEESDKPFVCVWRYQSSVCELRDTGIFIFQKAALRTEETSLAKIGSGIKYFETEEPTPETDHASIIFLSYDEPNADANWKALKKRFPHAKRVHKVEGILNAHKQAALESTTPNFFVVDGDSEILESFTFELNISEHDREHYVHIWKCLNPVNGLEYGYGGVKLFHKSMFTNFDESIVDMTTLLGDGVKLIDECVSITRFDSDDFHTFRSAFRECTKLSSGIIKNQINKESYERLDVWCSTAKGPYAEYALIGASMGELYGHENAENTEALRKINDFDWLKTIFRKVKMETKEKELLYTKFNKIDTRTIVNLMNILYKEEMNLSLEEIRDCLSFNELLSKFWLIDEFNKLGIERDHEIVIVGGLYGTMANFLFQFFKDPARIKRVLSVDPGSRFEMIADHLNIDYVIDGWRFKAVTSSLWDLNYDRMEGHVKDGDESKYVYVDYDVLIAPHLEQVGNIEQWAELLAKEKLIIAQVNNFGAENVDNIKDLAEFKRKLNFSKVLYEGVLPCEVYDRYMVIGYK